MTKVPVKSQETKGSIETYPETKTVIEIRETDRLTLAPRASPIREKHTIEVLHDGNAQLAVDYQHSFAHQGLVCTASIAPQRFGTANDLALILSCFTGNYPAAHPTNRKHQSILPELVIAAVLHCQLRELAVTAEKCGT